MSHSNGGFLESDGHDYMNHGMLNLMDEVNTVAVQEVLAARPLDMGFMGDAPAVGDFDMQFLPFMNIQCAVVHVYILNYLVDVQEESCVQLRFPLSDNVVAGRRAGPRLGFTDISYFFSLRTAYRPTKLNLVFYPLNSQSQALTPKTTSLPKTYKHAIFKEQGQPLVIEEVPLQQPGRGEILVKVKACGVCFSHIFAQINVMGGGLHDNPMVPGHEIVGKVAAVGEGVKQWSEGFFHICDNQAINGETRAGGYAEYVLLRSEAAIAGH
ncbi:GroES-like protein [Karstenula rhodostoma CBS 690.94]|uniref:GroES-like protein n=1 Tax=Karstenula rhodostoma CBS 690.94 TaxID=1392251 RepID=A0A9P4PJV0_9PLEO|nr:GroES-like protein [Karstenula rhodostoma CBS 690.94]